MTIEKLKERLVLELDEFYTKHNKPMPYKALFGNLYSTLKGAMPPKELALQMDAEGLIYMREMFIGRKVSTWLMPATKIKEIDPAKLDVMFLEACIERHEEAKEKQSNAMLERWYIKKLEDVNGNKAEEN